MQPPSKSATSALKHTVQEESRCSIREQAGEQNNGRQSATDRWFNNYQKMV